MRVLFVPRPDWETAFGGDAVQMRATAAELQNLGVDLDIKRPDDADLSSYDVIHLWTSLQMPHAFIADTKRLQAARRHAKLLLSPVWAPQHVLRWMMQATKWLFARAPDPTEMTVESARDDLEVLVNRALTLHTEFGDVRPYSPEIGAKDLREAIETLDMVLPNSWMELAAIQAYIGVVPGFHIVPNGVDAQAFLREPEFALPPELKGEKFVMMSARFDARKQQDMVLLALKDLDIPLVFIGEPADSNVFTRFATLGKNRKAPLYYFGRMEQNALRAFYAGAAVHMLPSIFESPGLSSIEAALLDCSIVVGALAFEIEYFREDAYYCDPCNVWSIAKAVQSAYDNVERDAPRRAALRERILTDFTWRRAAEETLAGYRTVLQA